MLRVAVIGSGFSGLSAACYLSSKGYEVEVFEKNGEPGGRARQLKTGNGFVFDMGPSWYWMPDVFERFFGDFGYKSSDFYDLKLLDPAFDIVFGENEIMHVPADFGKLCELFESIEKGSSGNLNKFLVEAEFKYKTGILNLVYKPGLSLKEFVDPDLIKGALRLQVFSSLRNHVRKHFSDKRLVMLMEFPVLFLGASPAETPALYSLMNYAALKLGTYYPSGGFGNVINAFVAIAESFGAKIHYNSAVRKINVSDNYAVSLNVNGDNIPFDGIIASADYNHVESELIDKDFRNYSEHYWEKKTFAPSCLIYYLGINKRLHKLNHHTLFFDESLDAHTDEIYGNPGWPSKPLFYACCSSKTDSSAAPLNHENIFLLIPIAAGLDDSEDIREKYFRGMIEKLEKLCGEKILPNIVYKQSYCVSDFVRDYNSYKGNAYGLANTLSQTAVLKPKIRNLKIRNLFYAGQTTVPGPGVPPSIISGKIASDLLDKELTKLKNEISL